MSPPLSRVSSGVGQNRWDANPRGSAPSSPKGSASLPLDLLLVHRAGVEVLGLRLGAHVGAPVVDRLLRGELLAELGDRLVQGVPRVVVELAGLPDPVEHALVLMVEEAEEVLLEGADVLDLDLVELAGRAGPDADDLLLDGERAALLLLEQLDQASATRQLGPRRRVEVGGEHRERLHGPELREVELEPAGDVLHGLDLRVAADPGDRDTH